MKLIDVLLNAIARREPYSPKELKNAYLKINSIDKLLIAIDVAREFNVPLEHAIFKITKRVWMG